MDTERSEVIQMAAKIAFLDHVWATYGPEAADARSRFQESVNDAIKRMWPEEATLPPRLAPNTQAGTAQYAAIQNLSPSDETQRKLKDQAASIATDLGQLRFCYTRSRFPPFLSRCSSFWSPG